MLARLAEYYSVFQFTPLREGRRARFLCASGTRISIHAPPRGATALLEEGEKSNDYFNSRPSARGDISV